MRATPLLLAVAALAVAAPRAQAQAVRLRSVSAGGSGMNCALADDGRAWCWGTRADWSRGRRVAATPVAGVVRFVSFTTIRHAGCGLGSDSLAYCIGENEYGVLGDDSPANGADGVYYRTRLGPVAGGRRFRSVSAGGQAACGIALDGQLWCWGSNEHGVFGNGAPVAVYDSRTGFGGNVPVASGSGARLVSVSVGWDHACGLDDEGTAWCWGRNAAGQLGDGTREARFVPRPADGDHRYRQISAGFRTTCAITQDGAALCWGDNNGAIGDGTTGTRLVPTPVTGGVRWRMIATWRGVTCAVAEDDAAWCWGLGIDGMLGTGVLGDENSMTAIAIVRSKTPVRVTGGVRFQSVSVGGYSGCGVYVEGDAWCWGRNDDLQLGVPNASSPGGVNKSATPLRVPIRATPARGGR